MDNEWFFEKFELIAELPDAASRMRELVLELAFSGRFSAGDRINEIPNEWKSDGSPSLPDIPSTWLWLQGKDVFNVIRGVSYKKDQASEVRVDGYVPLLRANNIGLKVNFDELVYVPRNIVREEQMVQRGDILIAMSSGSKKLVGKAASIQNNIEYTFGAFCGIIRNKSDISNDILAWYFKSPQYTSWVTAAGRGIGINNLTKGDLESLPIPLPPLSEQHRIVSKVEELMGICDALEAQQQEREERKVRLVTGSLKRFSDTPSVENLGYLFHGSYSVSPSDLRKTILTLAVQGKLVPQDPAEGSVDEALYQTEAIKSKLVASKKISRPSAYPSIPESGLPFDIPGNWQWIRLESICELITKGSSPTWQGIQYVEEPSNGVLFITSENVGTFHLRKMDDRKYVERKFNDIEPRSILLKGDLLVNLVGASIGRCAIYNLDDVANINQAVGIIRLVNGQHAIDREYLLYYLNSPSSLAIMFEEQVETARANLSLTNMKHFLTPLPPLAEQRRIVSKVKELMSMVHELEKLELQTRHQGTALLDAIVHRLSASAGLVHKLNIGTSRVRDCNQKGKHIQSS